MNNGRRFTDYFYNGLTLAGALLALVIFLIEAVFLGVDLIAGIDSAYFGVITYLVLPPLLIFGIALIFIGAVLARRRIRRDPNAQLLKSFRVDFSDPRHRNTAIALVGGGALFALLSAVGIYQTYHFTESVTFCGEVCHQVMKPEHTAYQSSPHSRVACASCHIGPGAGWFARSKLSGSYQIYAVLMNKYPRPIPTPIHNLRPAQETCEQCHWPQHFYSPKERTIAHFAGDEKNTPRPVRMMIHVGGGEIGKNREGIHWHMNINNVVEYLAADEAHEKILVARTTNRTTGEVREYRSASGEISDTVLRAGNLRKMDCIDCHNRPSHRYPSPQSGVDNAIALGDLEATLPYVKREAVKALDQVYATEDEAMTAIAGKLRDFYSAEYPDLSARDPDKISGTILAVQKIYRTSQFPEMRASWKSYPDHIGHLNSAGCFRCHNSEMSRVDASATGQSLARDCNTCHTFLNPAHSAGGSRSYVSSEFSHPGDIGDAWKETACHECHQGGAELY